MCTKAQIVALRCVFITADVGGHFIAHQLCLFLTDEVGSLLVFLFSDSASFMALCNQTAVRFGINNSCDFTRRYCISVAMLQDVVWPESTEQQQNE